MNSDRLSFLRQHAETLARFAAETEARSHQDPGNRLLQAVAHNQRQCADEAALELQQAIESSIN